MVERCTAAVARFVEDWLASDRGFRQFTICLCVWVALSQLHLVDATGFWLLYYLTVFSGWTQFPLMKGNREATEKAQAASDNAERLLWNSIDMMRALLALMERMEESVEEILDDVEQDLAVPHPRVPDDEKEVG